MDARPVSRLAFTYIPPFGLVLHATLHTFGCPLAVREVNQSHIHSLSLCLSLYCLFLVMRVITGHDVFPLFLASAS